MVEVRADPDPKVDPMWDHQQEPSNRMCHSICSQGGGHEPQHWLPRCTRACSCISGTRGIRDERTAEIEVFVHHPDGHSQSMASHPPSRSRLKDRISKVSRGDVDAESCILAKISRRCLVHAVMVQVKRDTRVRSV